MHFVEFTLVGGDPILLNIEHITSARKQLNTTIVETVDGAQHQLVCAYRDFADELILHHGATTYTPQQGDVDAQN